MSELVFQARDGSTLTFRVTERLERHLPPNHPYRDAVDFDVEVDAGKFTGRASTTTYHMGSPSALFHSIAESWRGWTGTKEWKDAEGRVVFKASSDTTGHTQLIVELSDTRHQFLLRAPLFFDAGQLDDIALQVQKLLG